MFQFGKSCKYIYKKIVKNSVEMIKKVFTEKYRLLLLFVY